MGREEEVYLKMLSSLGATTNEESESAQNYVSLIFNHFPFGTLLLDQNGDTLAHNQKALELLGEGIDKENTNGLVYSKKIAHTNQDYPVEELPYFKALDGNFAIANDIQINKKHERYIIEISAYPIKGADNNTEYVLTFVKKVDEVEQTDKKNVRSEIHEEKNTSSPLLALNSLEFLKVLPQTNFLIEQNLNILMANFQENSFQLPFQPKENDSISDIFDSKITENFKTAIEQTLSTKKTQVFEFEFPNFESKIDIFSVSISIFQENTVLALFSNETTRKTAAQKLENNDKFTDWLAVHELFGIWSYDNFFQEFTFSDYALNLLNIETKKPKVSLKKFLNFIHPNDVEAFKNAFIKASAEKRNIDALEVQIQNSDGDFHKFEINAICCFNANGQVDEFRGFLRKSKKTDAGVSKLDFTLLENIVQDLTSNVAITTLDGRILYANPAAKELFGVKDVEFNDIHVLDFYKYSNERSLVINLLKKDEKIENYELELITKDGYEITILLRLVLTNYDGEQVALASFIDITEKKRVENQLINKTNDLAKMLETIATQKQILAESEKNLEQKVIQRTKELNLAKKAAETANKAKSRFIKNMSHELRTPLNAIFGFAQALSGNNNQNDLIAEILQNAKNLHQIIEDILVLAESGDKIKLSILDFSLNELLNQLYEKYFEQAKKKNLALKFDLDLHLPAKIETDKDKFTQILDELLENAIKFTNEGEVALEASYVETNSSLLLILSDTGIGMTEEETKSVLNPFTQLGNETNTEGGTGVGLPVILKFVRVLGGLFKINSKPQFGTVITINIPIKKVAEQFLEQPQQITQLESEKSSAFDVTIVKQQISKQSLAEIHECILDGNLTQIPKIVNSFPDSADLKEFSDYILQQVEEFNYENLEDLMENLLN